MKETFYFPHDYNASQDEKIILLLSECGLAGLGAFWIMIEILHQQPESRISKKAYQSHIRMYYDMHSNGTNDYDNICSTLVKTGLLTEEGGFISSERVNRNKKHREQISLQRSRAGKISANKRVRTNVERAVEQNATKERKGKEKKGKESNVIKVMASPESFIISLKTNPAYKGIDIDRELGKMDAWLMAHPGKLKTKRFIVNWLNRIDKPIGLTPSGVILTKQQVSNLTQLERINYDQRGV